MLVAPATADLLARLVQGRANDLLAGRAEDASEGIVAVAGAGRLTELLLDLEPLDLAMRAVSATAATFV